MIKSESLETYDSNMMGYDILLQSRAWSPSIVRESTRQKEISDDEAMRRGLLSLNVGENL